MSDDLALVHTVDFFAPIVDDPYLFGQIAAANALSDVYAMGGEPLTALNIVGFPAGQLPLEVLTRILEGAQDKVHEAGALIVGGHTIIDEELKFGLAVTGRAHPKRLLSNAAATPGERLVLTKPLGTGILATVAKQSSLSPDVAEQLYATMRSLNAIAGRAALDVRSACATDITGFGLLGHAYNIARASKVTLVIHAASVPILAGAREAAEQGIRTGGAERNESYLASRVDWMTSDIVARALSLDPQTSGGLLVSVPSDGIVEYLSRVPGAAEIGEVVSGRNIGVVLA